MIKSLYKMFQHWSKNGSVYLYSDPHFGDWESYTFRGLTTNKTKEELDQFQVDNINKVTAEDFVNKQANSDDYEIITKFAY